MFNSICTIFISRCLNVEFLRNFCAKHSLLNEANNKWQDNVEKRVENSFQEGKWEFYFHHKGVKFEKNISIRWRSARCCKDTWKRRILFRHREYFTSMRNFKAWKRYKSIKKLEFLVLFRNCWDGREEKGWRQQFFPRSNLWDDIVSVETRLKFHLTRRETDKNLSIIEAETWNT